MACCTKITGTEFSSGCRGLSRVAQAPELQRTHVCKVDLKQFRRISRDVTECDKGLAVVKRVVAPAHPCFHDRQCEAPTFGVVD